MKAISFVAALIVASLITSPAVAQRSATQSRTSAAPQKDILRNAPRPKLIYTPSPQAIVGVTQQQMEEAKQRYLAVWKAYENDEMRQRQASVLKSMSIDVDWQEYMWLELYDMEQRAREALVLKNIGVNTDWGKHTLAELEAMEATKRADMEATDKKKSEGGIIVGVPQVQEPSISSAATTTVYITKTGHDYHRAGCSYLRKSRIPISLADARAQGYAPCSRCRP